MTSSDAHAHVVGTSDECRAERADRGWSHADTWSFDTYLAGVIAGGVRELAANNHGYPGQLTPDEWRSILNQIADGFEWYVTGAFTGPWLHVSSPEFERAFDLLREWWGALWD